MEDFETLLKGSTESHGHLCPGQVVGVRMAILGCRLLGLNDPKAPDQIKKIIIYVEIDRCATDAIAYVTGVKLGRRSLKFVDYGIMAATFVNLETGKAYRVVSTEESRDLCTSYAPEIMGKGQQQLEAYKRMPDSVLFRVQEVRVQIPAPRSGKERFCRQLRQGRFLHLSRLVTPTVTRATALAWDSIRRSILQDSPLRVPITVVVTHPATYQAVRRALRFARPATLLFSGQLDYSRNG